MYRNFNLFPFQPLEKDITKKSSPIDQFGLVLRSTYSMLIAIALKTFLTSAVKVLTWLLATTTKICTNAWSRQDRSLSPSYQKKILSLPQKYKMHHTKLQVITLTIFILLLLPFICLYTFSAINFQGYCICPVSCYTLLSRFQLPWPLTGCHNTTTLFMVSNNECIIWHI